MPSRSYSRLAALLMVSGCWPGADDQGVQPRSSVVDSAGVTIVTSHSPAWDEGDEWEIDSLPTVSLGGVTSEVGHLVWQVSHGARLSDGRIALLTGGRETPRILVFNREGGLDRSIGRSGQGPGEFIHPGRFQVLSGDTLVVWEAAFGRVSSFDPEGNLLSIRHLDLARIQEVARFAGHAGGVVLPLSDGSFVTVAAAIDFPDREFPVGEFARRPLAFTRVHRDYSADTLGIYGGAEMVGYAYPDGRRDVLFPLFPAMSWVRSAGNPLRIHISHGDDRGIDVFDDAGSLVRVIRRSIDPMPVTDREWRTALYGRFDGMGIPNEDRAAQEAFFRANVPQETHFPVMTQFVVDRLGCLWVWDGGVGPAWTWSIFDAEGKWLGRMTLPVVSILDIGQDYLLGRQWDDMLVESVHEYRLDRRGSVSQPRDE